MEIETTGQGTENQGSQGAAGAGNQSSATGASLSDVMTGKSVPNNTATTEPGASGNAGDGAESGKDLGAQNTTTLAAWGAQLSKDVRENPEMVKSLSKFKSLDELSKSYHELSGRLGSSVQIPGKDATPEDQSAFWKRMGRPESADKYSFKQEHEGAKAFAKTALEANLSDAQAQAVYKHLETTGGEALKQREAAMQRQQAETEATLKTEYGEKFPQAVENLRRGLDAFGGDELRAVLINSGLAYDPVIVRSFSKIGAQLSEAGATSRTGGAGTSMKPLAEGGQFAITIK